MKQKLFKSISLRVMMQDNRENASYIPAGSLSINLSKAKATFQEKAKQPEAERNDKLFTGDFCCLVHMKNGKYQIHMKTLRAQDLQDRQNLTVRIYTELLTAINLIV